MTVAGIIVICASVVIVVASVIVQAGDVLLLWMLHAAAVRPVAMAVIVA